MKKIIHLVIEDTCSDCPYQEYDSYYSIGTDSGHNCNHPESTKTRIADDSEFRKFEEWHHQKEKYPLLEPEGEMPKHPLTIPEWCPLEDE